MLAIRGQVLEQPCGGRGSLARPSGPSPAHRQSRGSGEDSGRHVKQSLLSQRLLSACTGMSPGHGAWGPCPVRSNRGASVRRRATSGVRVQGCPGGGR